MLANFKAEITCTYTDIKKLITALRKAGFSVHSNELCSSDLNIYKGEGRGKNKEVRNGNKNI